MKKKVVALMLGMMVAFAGVQTVPAMAETNVNSYQTADVLSTTVSDDLNPDESRWYKYTMPSSGHVHFELTNPDADKRFRLTIYDPKVHEIVQYDYNNTTETSEFAFEPGTTIYLKVENEDWGNKNSTHYTLNADFTSASDWENDYTNDELSGAEILENGVTEYGSIITDNDADWYKFVMPSDGTVSVTLENTNSVSGDEWNIQLYNTEKDEKYNDYNDDSDYSFTTDAIREKAGHTVYIKVTNEWNAERDTYQITPHFTADNASAGSDNSNDDSDSHDYGDEVASAPAKVTGVKISNAKGAKAKVSFTGQDVAAGYQVWYSYSGKIKRKYVYDTTSTKISVPKGKKVSVKVRAFTYDDNDERQFGAWSVTKVKKTDKK